MVQQIDTRLNTELAKLEDKMTHNQAVLETRHSDLERSISQMLETQTKMQDSINRLVTGSLGTPNRGSILGNPPPWPRSGSTLINNTGEW